MAHADQPPRLAEWFPLTGGGSCKKQAGVFFECFSANGEQPEGGDAGAGARGLGMCLQQMASYDKCMASWRKRTTQKKLYRVQEEYRSS